jgi:Predicted endonuclease containing a URI domain
MYFVYLIINQKNFSYVGYTVDINKRILLHNKGKGAKYTKGSKWKLIYCKKYKSKSKALQEEYKLKKNHKLRNLIKKNYLYYSQSG